MDGQVNHAMQLLRTFLDALDRRIPACRKLSKPKWAGRNPLLGSIVRCRPELVVELATKVAIATLPHGPHHEYARTVSHMSRVITS
jgi:hypothetical protein